ncbi:hypothetical protein F5I97DRAFT_233626 [Phlebopus sp. FC_14]|nr:hypothetical protein F5I97DRAFT_233626 [Phlebopus sp. FC_14]
MPERPTPSQDDHEDLLLSCRYGDLQDIQDFITKFGPDVISNIEDENGNTVLHMTCGNGHIDVLECLLPLVSPSLLSKQNSSGSTPLHWAALNKHFNIAQKIVQFPKGPGIDLIDIKNTAGRSPLGEAEMAEWEDGAKWFVQVMKIDEPKEEEDIPMEHSQAVEVEIEDAEGQVAKMTINDSEMSKEQHT